MPGFAWKGGMRWPPQESAPEVPADCPKPELDGSPKPEEVRRKRGNTQDGNVGNEGDVAKHLALVALLTELTRSSRERMVSFETHAYRMHAPLGRKSAGYGSPPGVAAGRLVDGFDGPSVERYRSLEEASFRTAWTGEQQDRSLEYLCSTGLTARLLDPARTTFHWCEQDDATRAVLARQAAEANLRPVIHHDARTLRLGADDAPGAVAGVVDPFEWNTVGEVEQELWGAVETFVGEATAPGADGFLLMFQYGPTAAWSLLTAAGWQPAPVVTWRRGRFHLAAWATASFAPRLQAVLEAHGWRTLATDPVEAHGSEPLLNEVASPCKEIS